MSDPSAYPAGLFDTLDGSLQLIIAYWTEIYGDRDVVLDYVRSSVVQERWLQESGDNWWAAAGRLTCPLFRSRSSLVITIRRIDQTAADYNDIGDEDLVIDGTVLIGVPASAAVSYPVGDGVHSAALIADLFNEPTVVLTAGSDFTIGTDGRLLLSDDPFTSGEWTPYTDDDGNECIDLLLLGVRQDMSDFQKIYGSVIGTDGASTESYRRYVNAVTDSIVQGTTLLNFVAAIAAAADAPITTTTETVESITADDAGMMVITSSAVYRHPDSATVLVEVGEVLAPGTSVTDAVRFLDRSLPFAEFAEAVYHAVEVPASAFSVTLTGPLTFLDAEEDLVVEAGVSGFTKVTWDMPDDAGDVADFFDAMHANGVAAGATLANYLDRRENPTGQPSAGDLPQTVNPLRMLWDDAWRNGVCVVQVREASFGPDALGLSYARDAIRRLADPQLFVLLHEVS